MELFGIGSIATIAVVCFLVCEAVKAAGIDKKWCPIICGALGGILGCIAYMTIPEFPAVDYLMAIAQGIVSGWAATSAHQTYKQLFVKGSKKDIDEAHKE